MTGLISITATLAIAAIVVAIVANWDLDRQKKDLAELEKTWREKAVALEHAEERHRLAQGTLEFTEKLKREAVDGIESLSEELDRLEEEEMRALVEDEGEGEDDGTGEEVAQSDDPHEIRMARDTNRTDRF